MDYGHLTLDIIGILDKSRYKRINWFKNGEASRVEVSLITSLPEQFSLLCTPSWWPVASGQCVCHSVAMVSVSGVVVCRRRPLPGTLLGPGHWDLRWQCETGPSMVTTLGHLWPMCQLGSSQLERTVSTVSTVSIESTLSSVLHKLHI